MDDYAGVDTLDVAMLKRENEKLEDELEETLAKAERYKSVLDRILDRCAEIGLIESDPHSRYLYRTGKKEL